MSVALLGDSIAGRADVVPPAFVCSRTNVGLDAAWVHVAGDLDVATTPRLERSLRDSQLQARLVVLDLRDLAFMDCCGAHAIVNASISARQLGRRLVLLRGPPNVDRVFALTGSSNGGRDRRPRPGRAAGPSAPATRRSGSGSMSASAPMRAAAETV